MSPSEPAADVPPEVLAIAVALAFEWQAAEGQAAEPPAPANPWKWSGRREEHPTTYRWS